MNKMTPDKLEQLIHRELRALPPRRAPRTLESRVLAALEHQALIPWYHQSWTYWPAPFRLVFLIVGTLVAGSILIGGFLLIQGADTAVIMAEVSQRLTIFTKFYALTLWVQKLTNQVIGSIPALWLWGGVALFAALNATFFGLGAAAYRAISRKN